MRTHDSLTSRAATALLACALLAGVSPVTSVAAPAVSTPAIEARKAEAADAAEQLDELQADLEERSEEYLEVEAALADTSERITETTARLARANHDLEAAQDRLQRRASAIYRGGGVDYLAVFLGVSDFSDFVSRLEILSRIGRSDALVVSSVEQARAQVEQTQSSLETRRAEQVVLRDQSKRKRIEVEAAVARQADFLAGLESEITRMVAEERARRERVAREQAAAALAARTARASGPRGNARPFDPSALGAAHGDVVAVAERYLGVRYVWGGTSPSGFDCSGLTQYCYRQIGIELPRTSRSQFRVGAYIPPDRLDLLRAGDLVFFGRDADPGRIHHVGIYVGDGQYLHAPQSGDVVRVSSLTGRIESRGDYVGAVRP